MDSLLKTTQWLPLLLKLTSKFHSIVCESTHHLPLLPHHHHVCILAAPSTYQALCASRSFVCKFVLHTPAGRAPPSSLSTHMSERPSLTFQLKEERAHGIYLPSLIFLFSTYCYMMNYVFTYLYRDFVCWFTDIPLEPGRVLSEKSKGTPLMMHLVGLPRGHLQKSYCNKNTNSQQTDDLIS